MGRAVDNYVGKRIRHRRWMIGRSQSQLADAVGIKFQQIQKYEAGSNRVRASRLWDIGEALGVPIDFFFDGIDSAQPTDSTVLGRVHVKETAELLRAYYAISEAQRVALRDLARTLAA